jgi:ring-1,2-phenylacetyl-CoA epoxidase subunit PaaD
MGVQGIWAVLKDVPDPEIPAVSVTDLGIVRSVDDEKVVITPTYSGCPATIAIENLVRDALDNAGMEDVHIERVLFPPWTTDWITERGRAELKAYGIDPPHEGTQAMCPQCGSSDTVEVSRFGSTPCKAQWRCNSCLEPFDRFKCH